MAAFLLLAVASVGPTPLELERKRAFFHPLGAFGELVTLLTIVAILYFGQLTTITDASRMPHILFAQIGIMCLAFGLAGMSAEALLKRVWIALPGVVVLVVGHGLSRTSTPSWRPMAQLMSPLAAH